MVEIYYVAQGDRKSGFERDSKAFYVTLRRRGITKSFLRFFAASGGSE
jgi:hypothetical protein